MPGLTINALRLDGATEATLESLGSLGEWLAMDGGLFTVWLSDQSEIVVTIDWRPLLCIVTFAVGRRAIDNRHLSLGAADRAHLTLASLVNAKFTAAAMETLFVEDSNYDLIQKALLRGRTPAFLGWKTSMPIPADVTQLLSDLGQLHVDSSVVGDRLVIVAASSPIDFTLERARALQRSWRPIADGLEPPRVL